MLMYPNNMPLIQEATVYRRNSPNSVMHCKHMSKYVISICILDSLRSRHDSSNI